MDLFDFNDNEQTAKPLAERDARQFPERIHRSEAHRFGKFPAQAGNCFRPAGQLYFLGAARVRENDAGEHHRARHRRGVHQAERRQFGGGGRQKSGGSGAGQPETVRQAHLSHAGRVPSASTRRRAIRCCPPSSRVRLFSSAPRRRIRMPR